MLEQGPLITDWYSSEKVLDYLKVGDLLEFRRTVPIGGTHRQAYTHWAVFVGEGEVIHISTPDGDFDVAPEEGRVATVIASSGKIINGSAMAAVRRDPLTRVAGADLLRINNGHDWSQTPFGPEEIVKRAEEQLGSGDYNFLMNNCEHFCKYIRYDNRTSSQVVNGTALAVGVALAVVVNPVVGLASSVVLAVGSEPVRRLFSKSNK